MNTSNIDLQILEVKPRRYHSSASARSRRGRNRPRKGGKPGQKCTFTGQRYQYLLENIDGLRSVQGTARLTQNQWWAKFYATYWAKFHWELPLDREPSPDDVWRPEKELSPEELDEKADVIAKIQAQLKSSLRNLNNARLRRERNPWTPLFASLNRIATASPPRQMADWQLYMHVKPEEVQKIFLQRWPSAGLKKTEALAFRGRIARELLELEPDDYRTELKADCVRRHREDLKAHALKELPRALRDDEQRMLARQELASVVQPLLEIIAEYTGFKCTLIAGAALVEGEQEFQVKIMNAGQTDGPTPMYWNQAEGATFVNQVVGSYSRFLSQTSEYKERLARLELYTIGPDPSASAATSSASTPHPPSLGPSLNAGDSSSKGKGKSRSQKCTSSTKVVKQKAKKRQAVADPDLTEEDERDDEEDEDEEDEDEEDEDEDEEGEGEGEDQSDPWDLSAPDERLGAKGLTITQEDEDEEDDEDDDEDDDDDPPTPDELGLNDAVKEELAALSERLRRRRLWEISTMSEYDLHAFNVRTQNRVTMRKISEQFGITSASSTAKKVPPPPARAAPKGPRRQSSRLNARTTAASENSQEDASSSTSRPRVNANTPGDAPPGIEDTPHTTLPNGEGDTSRASPTVQDTPGDANSLGSDVDNPQAPSKTSGNGEAGAEGVDNPRTPSPSGDDDRGAATSGGASSVSGGASSVSGGASSVSGGASSVSGGASSVSGGASSVSGGASSVSGGASSVSGGASSVSGGASSVSGGASSVSGGASSVSCATAPTDPIICEDAWPDWVRGGYDRFMRDDHGSDFKRAVGWWTTLERAYQWQSSSTGLSTAHRPAAVHKWLQLCRRNYDQRPEMSDEVSFAEAWWKWWTELQPAWRDRSADGRPVVGATVGDNWQTLARPGKNGMLITLLTLLWWKEVATQATEASWADAVKDVAWVMEQLAKTASHKRSLPSDLPESSTSSKKKRRK